MPLEIRELVIKATINNNSSSSNTGSDTQASGDTNINEIVEKVLEIIKEKSER